VIGFIWVRLQVEEFRAHVRQGFAILSDRPRFLKRVIVPQAISWFFRIASLYFFLKAFGVTANIHNALLAQVVDSLATLFPATPGGAGTKQGLTEFLFRGSGVSHTTAARVQRRLEHHDRRRQPRDGLDRNRSDGEDAVVQAVAAALAGRRAAGLSS